MNDKAIDEMGKRELDVAVAEEVMGYDTDRLTKMPGAGPYRSQTYDLYFPNGMPLPHYSREIAAAWKVVREMDVGATIWHSNEKVRVCWTDNYSSALEVCQHTRPDVTADTAPLAICRAALKAVREEDS